MTKKFFRLAVIAVATFSLAVTASAMTIDLAAEFDAMMADEGTYLQRAGDPEFTFADGKITVSGRTADWNAVDFLFGSLEAGVDYTLTVNFATEAPSGFLIAQADSPWGWLKDSGDVATTGVVVLEFTLDDDLLFDGQNRVRLFQTDAAMDDYSITGITLTSGAAAPPVVDEAPPVVDEAPPVIADDDSEDKHEPDTGIGDVAVASAIALLAAGAVIFSRKKK